MMEENKGKKTYEILRLESDDYGEYNPEEVEEQQKQIYGLLDELNVIAKERDELSDKFNEQIKEIEKLRNTDTDEYVHAFIKMPAILKTPIKQYCTYFNDFVKNAKRKDVSLEVRNYPEGLELLLSKKSDVSIDEISQYLSEYMGFILATRDDLQVVFDANVSIVEADLVMINLKSQVSTLRNSLDILELENRLLRNETENLRDLLKMSLTQPQNYNFQISQISSINISIEIQTKLPEIKSNFYELKDILESTGIKKQELDELGESLDCVTPSSDKDKLNKPFNKLSRFLLKLSDPNSDYNKIIKGSERAIELANKLITAYNIISPYLNIATVGPLLH